MKRYNKTKHIVDVIKLNPNSTKDKFINHIGNSFLNDVKWKNVSDSEFKSKQYNLEKVDTIVLKNYDDSPLTLEIFNLIDIKNDKICYLLAITSYRDYKSKFKEIVSIIKSKTDYSIRGYDLDRYYDSWHIQVKDLTFIDYNPYQNMKSLHKHITTQLDF